jgi:hypothetical protein
VASVRPGCEADSHLVAGVAGSLLDRSGTAEDDEVGQRDLLAAALGVVELGLDALEGAMTVASSPGR